MTAGSVWRAVYRRWRAVEAAWRACNPAQAPAAARLARRLVFDGTEREDAEIERQWRDLSKPDDAVFEEGAALCVELVGRGGLSRPAGDGCYDDVYHAALGLLAHGPDWEPSPDRARLFRGQRNADWAAVPTLYRKEKDGSVPVDARLGGLTAFVRFLQERFPGLAEEQGVALGQHYGHEAGTRTWLLDVSWDPLVALFFASDGGESGDQGVIQMIPRAEWHTYSAGGKNRLGAIRIIDAPQTGRIAAQRAFFIDTAHPDFFEQLAPYELRFRQKTGLAFEDPEHDTPINRAAIYPQRDEILSLLPAPLAHGAVRPLGLAPAGDAHHHLTGEDYFAIAVTWLAVANVPLDDYRGDTLRAACEVHARMQARPRGFGLRCRNLHRLYDAVQGLVRAVETDQYPRVAKLLELNTWAMNEAERGAFDAILEEVDT